MSMARSVGDGLDKPPVSCLLLCLSSVCCSAEYSYMCTKIVPHRFGGGGGG